MMEITATTWIGLHISQMERVPQLLHSEFPLDVECNILNAQSTNWKSICGAHLESQAEHLDA